jgi:predicted adenylyl cyclase CyaB
MDKDKIDFHLDKVFQERDEYIKYNFEIYQKIYNLGTIYYEDNVSEGLFEYCKNKDFFILLCLYDEDGKIFLERNLQETLFWSLPGGSIHRKEDMHSAVKRVASYILTDIEKQKILLGEIEPVSFIQNKFKYNGEEVVHHGIAFVARVRNKRELSLDNTLGSFIKLNEDEIKKINRYANREVARICYEKFKFFSTPFPENEIFVNEAQKWRYRVHDYFVKRFILNSRLKRKSDFVKQISSYFIGSKSIIDVSCGDSKLIFDIAKIIKPDFAVANDISWSQIDTIKQNNDNEIIFTNHNAAYLPFSKNSFDGAYCGNTLHHLTSKKELLKVFESILNISKKIIFVEIEKPSDTGFLPNILNKYWYIGFLKDAGGAYLSKDDFHSIIKSYFSDKAEIVFSEFKNIQGRYLIAIINKKEIKNSIIEVEEKFYLKDKSGVLNDIKKNNFKKYDSDDSERDIYFSDISGEYVKDRTCLRIRERLDKCEITYKGKSYSFNNSYAKVEKNIQIEPSKISIFEELFKSLGYLNYSIVNKKREGWYLKDEKVTHNIFLDHIEGVGSFLEIESIGDTKTTDKEYVISENKKIISLFQKNLVDDADLPYRDFVAQHFSNKFLKKQKLKAVLLDFDGTIVPSEEIFFKSYKKIVQKVFDEDIQFGEYKNHEIHSDANFLDLLIKKSGKNVDKVDFMEQVYIDYDSEIEKLFENEDVVINLNLLEKIKNSGIKLGIVSSSKVHFINKVLEHFDKKHLFDLIIAREDVIKRKPDPEPYLIAIEKMGINKENILVIEDTLKGAVSAKGADLDCVISKKYSLLDEEQIKKAGFTSFVSLEQILMFILYA